MTKKSYQDLSLKKKLEAINRISENILEKLDEDSKELHEIIRKTKVGIKNEEENTSMEKSQSYAETR